MECKMISIEFWNICSLTPLQDNRLFSDSTTNGEAALDSDRHGHGFSHGFLEPKIAAFRTGLLHEAILRRYAFSEDG